MLASGYWVFAGANSVFKLHDTFLFLFLFIHLSQVPPKWGEHIGELPPFVQQFGALIDLKSSFKSVIRLVQGFMISTLSGGL